MIATAIRHVHFEDCGAFGDILGERGFDLRYIEAGRDQLASLELSEVDLVVGLGGPVSVYDQELYPWIRDELALFERCLRARKPLVGICLGAQMLAKSLGARVYPGPVKELGWTPLQLTAEGQASVVAPLGQPGVSMLHWHGDTFDLPQGARLLASTRAIENQIYQYEDHVLAFQCHPEIRGDAIESWLIGHAAEISATPGADVSELRAESLRQIPSLTAPARETFTRWLESVRL